MVLADPSADDVVFLATGTGVAPFKSVIDVLFERGWDEYRGRTREVWLFLGCGWEDDLPYRDHLGELDADRENFHFVPTLTREQRISDWAGETDYVQQVLVRYLEDETLENVALPPATRTLPVRDAETERRGPDPPRTDEPLCLWYHGDGHDPGPGSAGGRGARAEHAIRGLGLRALATGWPRYARTATGSAGPAGGRVRRELGPRTVRIDALSGPQSAGGAYRIRLPSALVASSVASSAVWLCRSSIGFTSTNSSDLTSGPRRATYSIAMWASR